MLIPETFLAQAAAPPSDQAVWIGIVVLALAQITTLGLNLVKIFVRKPPIEAEFATKQELIRVEERLSDQLITFDGKRSRQVAELHNCIREVDMKVERLLGRLEH